MTRSQSCTSQHWAYLPPCEYIQLAMITGGVILRYGEPEEEMVELAQLGQIETIMKAKKSISLAALFSINPLVLLPSQKPCRVLIEGAPGVGKSTFALHICQEWAQGASFLTKFDLVVLVYLRDQAIRNARSLADILPAGSLKEAQMAATQIQACHGQSVLFVFDGWDEFPPDLQKNSLVSTILQKPEKLSLHKSTIFITSRPVSSGNVLRFVNQQVEILGFTRLQIHKYIKEALNGNTTDIQKLVEHLEDHPNIEGYCYIPLHAAMLVYVYLTMNGVLPTTLHQLFSNLVLCCIAREQETHGSDGILPKSLDDLPWGLKSHLRDLCVLAYEGVMQDKIVFYQRDLKTYNVPSSLPSMGLLQAVEGITFFSKSHSYNFLHLSVQELLAAYHISQLKPSEQLQIFQQLIESARFPAVLKYYSGITKLKNSAIQNFIKKEYIAASNFVSALPFQILHCFFEAQQPSLCWLFGSKFQKLRLDAEYLNPVDILAIGYIISSLLAMSKAPMQLTIMHINDHQLKLLITELSKYPAAGRTSTSSTLSGKLVMHLYIPHFYTNGAELIASHIKQSPAINELVVCNNYYTENAQNVEDALLFFAEALQTNNQLTTLDLHGMNFHYSEANGAALVQMLVLNKSLTHLDLSNNIKISDPGACCIFQGLHHNTTLVHLNLSSTGIMKTSFEFLTEALQANKALAHLNLSDNNISDSGAHCIFRGLHHNTTLVHLNLSSTRITMASTQFLAEMLQANKGLAHLNLSYNNISDSGAHFIFQGLHHNTTLVHLNLSSTGITMASTQFLAEMLQVNKAVAHLNLSYNNISDSGACCIFQGLEHNTTLTHIDLCKTSITGEGTVMCIAQTLDSNCSLQTLDISDNMLILDHTFFHITKSLESNSTLRKLTMFLTGSFPKIAARDNTLAPIVKQIQAVCSERARKGLHRIKFCFNYN